MDSPAEKARLFCFARLIYKVSKNHIIKEVNTDALTDTIIGIIILFIIPPNLKAKKPSSKTRRPFAVIT